MIILPSVCSSIKCSTVWIIISAVSQNKLHQLRTADICIFLFLHRHSNWLLPWIPTSPLRERWSSRYRGKRKDTERISPSSLLIELSLVCVGYSNSFDMKRRIDLSIHILCLCILIQGDKMLLLIVTESMQDWTRWSDIVVVLYLPAQA